MRNNGSYNLYPHESCRDCFLAKKAARGGRKSVAANTPSGPAFEAPQASHSPSREARISSASIAHTNARLCGQATGHANHPRLEVLLSFATPGGRKEFKVIDAVANSGAQIMIVPASLLEHEGIAITGLRQSRVDLQAANKAKINVQGIADVAINALLPNGERFRTTTAAYVVKNVDETYLSLDVLKGLCIVNEHFPAAGAGNQHGAQQGAWDRTDCHRTTPPCILQHMRRRFRKNIPTYKTTLASILSARQPGNPGRRTDLQHSPKTLGTQQSPSKPKSPLRKPLQVELATASDLLANPCLCLPEAASRCGQGGGLANPRLLGPMT